MLKLNKDKQSIEEPSNVNERITSHLMNKLNSPSKANFISRKATHEKSIRLMSENMLRKSTFSVNSINQNFKFKRQSTIFQSYRNEDNSNKMSRKGTSTSNSVQRNSNFINNLKQSMSNNDNTNTLNLENLNDQSGNRLKSINLSKQQASQLSKDLNISNNSIFPTKPKKSFFNRSSLNVLNFTSQINKNSNNNSIYDDSEINFNSMFNCTNNNTNNLQARPSAKISQVKFNKPNNKLTSNDMKSINDDASKSNSEGNVNNYNSEKIDLNKLIKDATQHKAVSNLFRSDFNNTHNVLENNFIKVNDRNINNLDNANTLLNVFNNNDDIKEEEEDEEILDLELNPAYSNYSLFLFSRNNYFRSLCFKISSSKLFKILMMIIIMLDGLNFTLMLNLKDNYYGFSKKKPLGFVYEALDYCFYSLYIIEALIHIISNGFMKQEKSYIKKNSNIVDLILIVISTLPYVYKQEFYLFSSIRHIRILRLLYFLTGLNNLVIMLVYSAREFFGIFNMMIYYLIIFGYISMILFSDRVEFKCMTTPYPALGMFNEIDINNKMYIEYFNKTKPPALNITDFNEDFFAMTLNQSDSNTYHPTYFPDNLHCGGIYECPTNSYCKSYKKAFDSGYYFLNPINKRSKSYLVFNRIDKAIFSLFVSITSNSMYTIMYKLQNSYDFYLTAMFFYFVVIILFYYFILKVSVGIMINSCRINYQISEGNLTMEERLLEINEVLDNYGNKDFDLLSHMNIASENDKKNFKRMGQTFKKLSSNNKIREEEESVEDNKDKPTRIKSNMYQIDINLNEVYSVAKNMIKEIKWTSKIEPFYIFHSKWNIPYICYFIIQQPFAKNFLTFISFINLFLIAYQTNYDDNAFYKALMIFIVILFLLASVLRIIGNSLKNFANETANVYDLVIVILTILEYCLRGTFTVSVLLFLRSLSVLFYLKEFKSLGIAYKCLVSTGKEMMNYIILFMIVAYFFIITGQNFFMNKLKYKFYYYKTEINEIKIYDINHPIENLKDYEITKNYDIRGKSPILNFDTSYKSLITVFNIFLGDDWPTIFEDCLNSELVYDYLPYVYFLVSVLILSILMKNLVIAFLIFHFEVSRKKFVFEKKYSQYLYILKQNKIKRTKSFSFKNKIELRKFLEDPDKKENKIKYNYTDSIYQKTDNENLLELTIKSSNTYDAHSNTSMNSIGNAGVYERSYKSNSYYDLLEFKNSQTYTNNISTKNYQKLIYKYEYFIDQDDINPNFNGTGGMRNSSNNSSFQSDSSKSLKDNLSDLSLGTNSKSKNPSFINPESSGNDKEKYKIRYSQVQRFSIVKMFPRNSFLKSQLNKLQNNGIIKETTFKKLDTIVNKKSIKSKKNINIKQALNKIASSFEPIELTAVSNSRHSMKEIKRVAYSEKDFEMMNQMFEKKINDLTQTRTLKKLSSNPNQKKIIFINEEEDNKSIEDSSSFHSRSQSQSYSSSVNNVEELKQYTNTKSSKKNFNVFKENINNDSSGDFSDDSDENNYSNINTYKNRPSNGINFNAETLEEVKEIEDESYDSYNNLRIGKSNYIASNKTNKKLSSRTSGKILNGNTVSNINKYSSASSNKLSKSKIKRSVTYEEVLDYSKKTNQYKLKESCTDLDQKFNSCSNDLMRILNEHIPIEIRQRHSIQVSSLTASKNKLKSNLITKKNIGIIDVNNNPIVSEFKNNDDDDDAHHTNSSHNNSFSENSSVTENVKKSSNMMLENKYINTKNLIEEVKEQEELDDSKTPFYIQNMPSLKPKQKIKKNRNKSLMFMNSPNLELSPKNRMKENKDFGKKSSLYKKGVLRLGMRTNTMTNEIMKTNSIKKILKFNNKNNSDNNELQIINNNQELNNYPISVNSNNEQLDLSKYKLEAIPDKREEIKRKTYTGKNQNNFLKMIGNNYEEQKDITPINYAYKQVEDSTHKMFHLKVINKSEVNDKEEDTNYRNKFIFSDLRLKNTKTSFNKVSDLNLSYCERLIYDFNNYWKGWPNGFSLLIFSPKMKLRIATYKFLENEKFHYVILFIIIWNVVVLSLEYPYLDPNSTYVKWLHYQDYFFSIFFFTEMLLRVAVQGAFYDSKHPIKNLFCMNTQKKKPATTPKIATNQNIVTPSPITRNNDIIHKRNSKFISNRSIRFISPNDQGLAKKTPTSKTKKNSILKNSTFDYKKPNNIEKDIYSDDEMKYVTKNFFSDIPAYFRDLYNIVDTIVTVYAFVLFTYNISGKQSSYISSIASFKALAALRPLTMISKFGNLRRLVETILKSIPMVFSLFAIVLLFCIILGIIVSNYLGGILGECSLSIFKKLNECKNNGGVWTSYDYSYDKLNSAILIMVEVGSSEDWMKIMMTSLTSYYNSENESISSTFFIYSMLFLAILIVAAIFLIHLTYAVIVDSYSNLKEEELKSLNIINQTQKNWYFAIEQFLSKKLIPIARYEKYMPRLSRKILTLINSPKYERILAISNLVFFISLFTTSSSQPKGFSIIQFIIFTIYVIIINLDLVFQITINLKFYFKYKYYFSNFIFTILIDTAFLIELLNKAYDVSPLHITEDYSSLVNTNNFNLITVLVGLKTLKLGNLTYFSKRLEEYRNILKFLIPNILNITYLIVIFFLIFANVGMSFFGKAKYGTFINFNNNFQTFERSLLLLIRLTIGGKWNRIMRELGNESDGCLESQTYSSLMINGPMTCGSYIAYLYFISFFVLVNLLVMNLFVAIVVDCFIISSRTFMFIRESDLKAFYNNWNKYDKELTMRISPEDFILFMIELPAPLGFTVEEFNRLSKKKYFKGTIFVSPDNNVIIDRINVLQLAKIFNFKLQNGKVHMLDVIKLVCKRSIMKKNYIKKVNNKSVLTKDFLNVLDKKFMEYDPTYLTSSMMKKIEKRVRLLNKRNSLEDSRKTAVRVSLVEAIANKTIQDGLRNWIKKYIKAKSNSNYIKNNNIV